MKHVQDLKEVHSYLRKIPFEAILEGSILLIFISFLFIVNEHNNLLFHTVIELFINFVFIAVFVIAINTYKINKNNFLLLFGTGYLFVGIVGVFHLLTYSAMPFFSKTGVEVSSQLWIVARYLGAFTSLISVVLVIKPYKKVNPYILFMIFFCSTSILLMSILTFDIFPKCFVENVGLSKFKIISELIVSSLFLITAIIYFNFKDRLNRNLFIFLETFLGFSIVAELLFTNYVHVSEWTNYFGHVFKGVAAYSLYKGVIEIGLKRPYDLINQDLNLADTKVKEFEKTMMRNEQCREFIINNSDNAIVVICDNKFVFANDKVAKLLGTEYAKDIVGLDIYSILPLEVQSDSRQRVSSIYNSKKSIPYTESKLLRFDGQRIDVEVTSCYFSYQGSPSIIAMFRDITPKKQIKKLENSIVENKKVIDKTTELNKMLTEFFSNISHELKTPLNVILGAIQILLLPSDEILNNSLEPKLNKHLRTMKQNCYRLLRLVNNLIDLSKFDSGYFKLNLKNYDIVNIVEDITLSVADYIENKGIDLIFDTDIEEKLMAVDVDKIERIILNLLSNAIKFTNEGGQILVNLWDKNDRILISVKDTGVGIPQDKLDVIFDRFGQVDKTLARNREGSGIGLPLIKSIAEMHGGNIKVSSEFGKGSEFIVELPVRLVEENDINDTRIYESKVEKISIEFSDIYS